MFAAGGAREFSSLGEVIGEIKNKKSIATYYGD
jgi:hypothetical protein